METDGDEAIWMRGNISRKWKQKEKKKWKEKEKERKQDMRNKFTHLVMSDI
jgi:uncharacterized protein (DUF924 family)